MDKKLTFGSVCDGIGCGHLAFEREGLSCLWSAEIEPFPSAVLKERFPHVRNVGNMKKVRGKLKEAFIKAPDVFIGGCPCQAFSIAGLRKGLEDDRGNLSLEFCRIADAIDAVRFAAGKDGCVVCYENVPGLLSDKGNAFGCFLGMLAGEDEAIAVEKWPRAGVVCGTRRRVAWCVLDSQYFGVAQRRRRVFVVAVPNQLVERLGARADPAEILSIGQSKKRDTPSRKGSGEGVADDAGKRVEGGHWDGSEVHPTLNQSHNDGGIGASNQEIFSQRGAGLVQCMAHGQGGAEITQDHAPCLSCNHKAPILFDQPPQALYENHANDSRVTDPHEVSPMPTARMGTGGGNVPLVGPGEQKGDAYKCGGCSHYGYQTTHSTICPMCGADDYENVMIAPTIGSNAGKIFAFGYQKYVNPDEMDDEGQVKEPCVAISDVIHGDKACNGKGWNDDGSAYTLDTMATQGVCFQQNTRDEVRLISGDGDLAGCLSAQAGMKQQNYLATSNIPLTACSECDTLLLHTLERKVSNVTTNQTDACEILRLLRKTVGEEAYEKWCADIITSLQPPEILRQALHG